MIHLGEIKTIAVHEASHAAVAVRLSLGVEYAAIHFCTRYVGAMGYTPAQCKRFKNGELLGSKIQVALAGPIGESMHLNGTGKINPATFFGNWESLDGDVTCARDLAERMTTNRDDRDDLLARSAATAYGHLFAAWPGVLALAGFLFSHQYANAAVINSFFRK